MTSGFTFTFSILSFKIGTIQYFQRTSEPFALVVIRRFTTVSLLFFNPSRLRSGCKGKTFKAILQMFFDVFFEKMQDLKSETQQPFYPLLKPSQYPPLLTTLVVFAAAKIRFFIFNIQNNFWIFFRLFLTGIAKIWPLIFLVKTRPFLPLNMSLINARRPYQLCFSW